MSNTGDSTAPKQAPVPSRRRKPYTPPRLVSYRHVKDIIQGGGGMSSDAAGMPPGGRSKTFCWIAEALYGMEDPRTLLFRGWLLRVYDQRRPGWVFVALYRRFGRAVANPIHQGRLPRRLLRLWFDVLLEKALDDSACAIVAARR
jgi:hypothetical protein